MHYYLSKLKRTAELVESEARNKVIAKFPLFGCFQKELKHISDRSLLGCRLHGMFTRTEDRRQDRQSSG